MALELQVLKGASARIDESLTPLEPGALLVTTDDGGLYFDDETARIRLDNPINSEAPTYTQAASLTPLVSGEDIPTAFGKISKAVAELADHEADSVKHITNAERTAWNGKAETTVVTSSENGLMSSAMFDKLTGIEVNANNYVLPTATASEKGGVTIGDNINVTPSGTISVNSASTSTAGIVQLDSSLISTSEATAATSKAVNDLVTAINGKQDPATTLSGYGITDAYTKTEIDAMQTSAMHYKGSVATYAGLPTTGQKGGDMWNIQTADPTHGIAAGDNVVWNEDEADWDNHRGDVDLSGYVPTSRTINDKPLSANVTLDYQDVGAAAESHVHTAASATSESAGTAGFMSVADKYKLDNIAAGAEVNQNAFGKVKVGSTTIEAGSASDITELVAGTNVQLVPDGANKTVTISATDTTYTALPNPNGLSVEIDGSQQFNYTGSAAATLDLESGDDIEITNDNGSIRISSTVEVPEALPNEYAITVNVYSGTDVPTPTAYNGAEGKSVAVASKDAIVGIIREGTTFTATRADGSTTTFTQQDSDTTYDLATTSSAGLMSAGDKTTLDSNATMIENSCLGQFTVDSNGQLCITISA